MFTNNITQTYNHLDASMEIIIMLLGSFLLGFLSCWIFKKLSNKASQLKEVTPEVSSKNTNTASYTSASDTQASKQEKSIESNTIQYNTIGF